MPKKSLVGQLAVANPLNPTDGQEFAVTLIVSDDREATVGVQINRPIPRLNLGMVCQRVGIKTTRTDPIYRGGRVNSGKIYVIHSVDWQSETTCQITDDLSITNDLSILRAINSGSGPQHFRACAGFWIWPPRQLWQQIIAGPVSEAEHRWETINGTAQRIFESGQHLDQWHNIMEQVARQHVDRFWAGYVSRVRD